MIYNKCITKIIPSKRAEPTIDFRPLLENLPSGVIFFGLQGQVLMTNAAIERMTGLPAQIFSLEEFCKFLPGIDCQDRISHVMQTGEITHIEEITVSSFTYEMFIVPVYDKGRRIIGSAINIQDITRLKELEHIKSELEMQKTKDDFFMLASHEMRTPLTAIRGNLELIKDMFGDEIKNEEILHMIYDAHAGTMRLIEIVSSFLDAIKLEQGRLLLQKEKTYPVAIIDELIHEFETATRLKGVALKIKIPDDLPMVLIDRARAKQVLYNLVNNAISTTENGSVTIEAIKRGGFVEISVSDTGRGIPQEKRGTLFKKFGQVTDILTHDATKGTGLGLYLSKLIIDNMGGKIELVKSEVDKGSTFRFTLPIAL